MKEPTFINVCMAVGSGSVLAGNSVALGAAFGSKDVECMTALTDRIRGTDSTSIIGETPRNGITTSMPLSLSPTPLWGEKDRQLSS
jgi:hypothetical protein